MNFELRLFETRHLPLIFRDSTPGMATMQTALMHIKLKAAEPTIVPGPNAPDSKLLPTISAREFREFSLTRIWRRNVFEIKIELRDTIHTNNGQQDFGGRWAQRHQRQIGHRVVPDVDFDERGLLIDTSRQINLQGKDDLTITSIHRLSAEY